MRIQHSLLVLFGLLCWGSAAHAAPRNFDDCILESMKGVTSDIAAVMITKSCRSKFPEPGPLPVAVLPRLAIDDNVAWTAILRDAWPLTGTVNNKTQDWLITSLTILVYPTSCPTTQCTDEDFKKLDSIQMLRLKRSGYPRTHTLPIRIRAGEKKKFTLPAITDKAPPIDLEWKITGASGYQTQP